MSAAVTPWPRWPDTGPSAWSVGVVEEVMLLRPADWQLAQVVEDVLERLPPELRPHVASETHRCAIELKTAPHARVVDAAADLGDLRRRLARVLAGIDLRGACAGTHPTAVWHDMRVAEADRHQAVYGSMRALARREPTFALHVHVGLGSAAEGIAALNQMRAHLPVLLALSANSPFWQGRDTGLASARTPLFQAFPRVGIPRVFSSYADWIRSVNLLLDADAIPDTSYLWWDVRLNPGLGTVEVRVMDAQADVERTAALVAFTQCLVRLELLEGYASSRLLHAQEVLEENRFLAARDGVGGSLIDPDRGRRVPVCELVEELLDACRPHAHELGCADELEAVRMLMTESGADRQRRVAGRTGARGLVAALADDFAAALTPA